MSLTFKTNSLPNKSQGKPCNTKSHQSINFMPSAPPNTHLIFPQTCGSGVKGANPKTKHSKIIVAQLFNGFKLFCFSFEAMGMLFVSKMYEETPPLYQSPMVHFLHHWGYMLFQTNNPIDLEKSRNSLHGFL